MYPLPDALGLDGYEVDETGLRAVGMRGARALRRQKLRPILLRNGRLANHALAVGRSGGQIETKPADSGPEYLTGNPAALNGGIAWQEITNSP